VLPTRKIGGGPCQNLHGRLGLYSEVLREKKLGEKRITRDRKSGTDRGEYKLSNRGQGSELYIPSLKGRLDRKGMSKEKGEKRTDGLAGRQLAMDAAPAQAPSSEKKGKGEWFTQGVPEENDCPRP